MASPETYLAHSKSLANKIKTGQLKADRNFLMEHLGNSYSESLKKKIVGLAMELSQADDATLSKSKNKDFQ